MLVNLGRGGVFVFFNELFFRATSFYVFHFILKFRDFHIAGVLAGGFLEEIVFLIVEGVLY